MQAAQGCRRRLAEFGPVGTGHAAEMGKTQIEGDIDDARIGLGALQLGVELLAIERPRPPLAPLPNLF
jgi:hypothetical protein